MYLKCWIDNIRALSLYDVSEIIEITTAWAMEVTKFAVTLAVAQHVRISLSHEVGFIDEFVHVTF
jgi:hypothetical protein